jgi:cation/acetate symporter
VLLSKILLLVVAVLAAYVASLRVADILFLVSAAFSLAAAGFFPALVLGMCSGSARPGSPRRSGMVAGVGVTFWYMITTHPWLHKTFGVSTPIKDNIWWDIQPISAGLFGVPLGFAIILLVSLVTPAPSKETQDMVENVRYPNLKAA